MSAKNTETIRLEEAREGKAALEEVGPVPERAPVGHGAGGLQRGRRRLGLLYPRSGPLPGLPLGGGRPGRALRRQTAPLLRPGPVERPGPHSQGTPLRLDQQRGQPRRGRQGILFLPGQHPHPLLHEVPLQVPQAAFPYDDLVETNRRRNREEMEYELLDTGVFDDDRYFDVFVEYAKAAPEDILMRSPLSTAVRKRPSCICCPPSGSATTGRRGLPDLAMKPNAQQIEGTGGHECDCRGAPGLGEYTSPARARRRCSSPTTKPTTSAFSAHPTTPPMSRTASTTTWCWASRKRSTPRRPAPRWPPTTGSPSAPAKRRQCGCGSPPRPLPVKAGKPTAAATPSARSLRRSWPPGGRRRTSSTSPSPRPRSARMRPR